MILALETGWTPDVLAELPLTFRAAAHWCLFVRAIVGEEGLEEIPTPPVGAPMELRLAVGQARAGRLKLAATLYPDDDV